MKQTVESPEAVAYEARILLMIVRNCSLVRGSYTACRIRTIMSNRGPLACGALAGEQ